MMEAAEEYLDGYYQQGKKILKADYSIEVISRESTEVVDSDIRDKKDLAETALLQLQEEYDNAVSSLSENELQYLNSYLEERNQAGYTEGEALDKTDISLLEDTGNGIAVKRIKIDTILGLMLGICCVLGYFIIAYCWSSVLVNGEELTSMYGLPVLGYVNQKENRKKIEWYFLKKKKKNVVFTDLESECRKIMERLQLQVSEGESIYLLSLRETEEKYQKVFIQEGRKQGISMTAGNGIDGISQNLKQADKILLIEEEGVSRYHEIEKEIALCYEAEKKICGTVIAV
jgi:hypothetical protein